MDELKEGLEINNRYLLKELKGKGTFGEVWHAFDYLLNLDVALKLYISMDENGLEEFRSEYLACKELSHPNLLKPLYFDIYDKKPFLVMDFCTQGSVSKLSGKLEEKEIWRFIRDVAAALNYLHNLPEPIIHQDIKPDNILISNSGIFQISDFGISRKVRSTLQKETQKRIVSNNMGAIAYMGPEKFEMPGAPIKASDIWALGVSIYELATGELPFSGMGGEMQIRYPSIPTLNNKWSKDLNKILQNCLNKNPWERFSADRIQKVAQQKLDGKRIKWTVKNKTTDKSILKKIFRKFSSLVYKKIKLKKVVWYILILFSLCLIDWALINFYKDRNNVNDSSLEAKEVLDNAIKKDSMETEEEIMPTINEIEINKESLNINNETRVIEETNKNKIEKTQKGNGDESKVEQSKSGYYNYGYAVYSGELRNGKPNGRGTIKFNSIHKDNLRDYSAEKDDYIVGFFSDGKLDHGILYDSYGNKIKSIH